MIVKNNGDRIGVAVLGATGSIGSSTASVLAAHPERFRTVALAAHSSRDSLQETARRLNAENYALTSETGNGILTEYATHPDVDIVLCAMTGVVGIEPVLAALAAGKRVALASKEVLVMAGDIVMKAAAESTGELIPVDSEHSAVFQCLTGRRRDEIKKITITASGGPFLRWSAEKIARATPAEALAHPTWSMGRKITIDSASLMNKALELIEAHHLFGVGADKLGVLVSPKSAAHGLVELTDGTFMICCSATDMRLAIQYAMSYPERLEAPAAPLDLAKIGSIDFEEPDESRFPSLVFAREAMSRGGAVPAMLNGANDVAVARFLAGEIPFTAIWQSVEKTLENCGDPSADTLEELQAADQWSREYSAALKFTK